MASKLEGDQAVCVKRQVEFYFSDSNAPRDKFLLEHIQADPEGYVDLSVICKFSRMQALLFPRSPFDRDRAVPETLCKQVGETLKECSSLEVNAEGTRVRRAAALDPEAAVKGVDERSLYAAPFPFDATLEGISAFFSEVGPINGVRLRRHAASKDFRGSVFVEFGSVEAMKQALQKSLLEFQHAPLHLEPKLDYMERKKQDRSTALLVEVADGYVPPEAPAQREASQPPAAPEAEADPEASPSTHDTTVKWQPGCVVSVQFAAEPLVGWLAVKAQMGEQDKGVRYVEMQKNDGQQAALVRFDSPEKAAAALEAVGPEGKVSVDGNVGTAVLLQGADEEALYQRMAKLKQQAETKQGGRGTGGRGRGRKGDWGARGGRGGRSRGGRSKRARF